MLGSTRSRTNARTVSRISRSSSSSRASIPRKSVGEGAGTCARWLSGAAVVAIRAVSAVRLRIPRRPCFGDVQPEATPPARLFAAIAAVWRRDAEQLAVVRREAAVDVALGPAVLAQERHERVIRDRSSLGRADEAVEVADG